MLIPLQKPGKLKGELKSLDFLSFDPQHLEQALEVCSDNLPKWKLQVNRDKTNAREFTWLLKALLIMAMKPGGQRRP